MKTTKRHELAEQRTALRARMQAQREQIALRLGPALRPGEGYPRSRMMRFLTRQPGLAIGLLAALAALTVGTRLGRPLNAILAATRIAGSVATNGAGRPRA